MIERQALVFERRRGEGLDKVLPAHCLGDGLEIGGLELFLKVRRDDHAPQRWAVA